VREAVALTIRSESPGVDQERLVRPSRWMASSSSGARTMACRRCCELPYRRRRPAATDDECNQLLTHFGFSTALGHLDQAIEAHTRGDLGWQPMARFGPSSRSVFDENRPSHLSSRLCCRRKLREPSRIARGTRLLVEAAERVDQRPAKNYVNGLFKMLQQRARTRPLGRRPQYVSSPRRVGHCRTFLRRLRNGS